MLWFGHTHAHNYCASDLWVEGIHTTSRDTRAASRPSHLPSHSDRALTLRNTTSYILLQRGFTPTPARCWAAVYGVGCLNVRAAKAVSMCLARATSRHVCFMSRQAARSLRPLPPIAGVCLNKIPTKLVFHWSSLAELPSFYSTFQNNTNKNHPQVWALCPAELQSHT